MTEDQRERLLRDALAEARRSTRRRTPGFALLWSRAVAEAGQTRVARKKRFALVATSTALALALALAIGLWTADRQSRTELESALTMATAVSDWQAPLDFLLDTPGQEWLVTTPGWDLGLAAEPWDFAPDLLQEVPQ